MKNLTIYKKPIHTFVWMVSMFVLAFTFTACDFEYDLPEAGSIADETPPTASFSAVQASAIEDYLEFTFSNTSDNATDYAWDFGDGNTSSDTEPTNIFPAEGSYTVTLTASDALGATSTYSAVVEVVKPEEPNAIEPEILNGDFDLGQDYWSISEFTGGTTSPFNSSSDGSYTNYDGSDNGAKTAGAKWTSSTSGAEWASSSSRYAYQAVTISPNTDYILEFEYAIKDDDGTDPSGGRRIVACILDGQFSDGVDALASEAAGTLLTHEGFNANGKTSHTLVKEQFTTNDSGEVAIWIYGVTPVDAYVDNVKIYSVDSQ